MTELFSRIEKLRSDRRASYRDLAAVCGVSPQNVQRWKAGGTVMPEHLSKLAVYFNTSVDYLLGGVQPQLICEKRPSTYATQQESPHDRPYACPACAVKDSEIAFLRDALKSALDRIPRQTP